MAKVKAAGTPVLVYESDAVLSDMSIADLEALNLEFMQVRAEVKKWQERINTIMSQKIHWEETIRKLDQMTPDARNHLLQVVQAKGVVSKESVNG